MTKVRIFRRFLELEDGYALNIVEVDVNGNSVRVQLEKDGDGR